MNIGKSKHGEQVTCNVDKLLGHRVLIQAASGGGKSWLLCLLCEQIAQRVQTIIIDPEGEFAAMRETVDLVLVGSGGEVPADPRNAKALARRLLELRTSAVVDLYELQPHARHAFVRDFLDSLMSAPRSLWRPLVVAIDEAHTYCPERGQGESVASGSVIDLLSRGRKRGFAGLLATQRLSKLGKSAAAECSNLIFGRTSPIDQQRAADLLGIPSKDRAELSRVADGEWFGVGPMFGSVDPIRFQAHKPKTKLPKPGESRTTKPPAPSSAIRKVAGELADLAKRDDETPLTIEEATDTIRRLRREAKTSKATPEDRERIREFERNQAEMRFDHDRARYEATLRQWGTRAKELQTLAERWGSTPTMLAVNGQAKKETRNDQTAIEPKRKPESKPRSMSNTDKPLPVGQTAVLSALIQFPKGLQRRQLTVLTTYKSGTRDAYIQRLKGRGLVLTAGDRVIATADGIAALPDCAPLPTGHALQEHWLQILPVGEERILRVLIRSYPAAVPRDALIAELGGQPSSRDAYIGRMRAKEIVEVNGDMIRASESLFT